MLTASTGGSSFSWLLSADAIEMDLHFQQFNYHARQTGQRSSHASVLQDSCTA